MSDYYNIIASEAELAEQRGHQSGLAEGILIGREEGREEGKLMTAKNLKNLGVDVHTISQATGLPIEIIESL